MPPNIYRLIKERPMSENQKEKVIREKRTIKATKKNLMGISGKIGLVAMTLGHPIMRQGSGIMDVSFLEDPYEDYSDTEYESTASGQPGPQAWKDEIKQADDDLVYEEGYVFDGLSRGMHLDIKYMYHNQRIEVTYKGYQVYKEIAGELFAYSPSKEWEDKIERLYKIAKVEAKQNKRFMEVQLGQEIERKKASFWERMRTRWGI
jgi:hypothetical protein